MNEVRSDAATHVAANGTAVDEPAVMCACGHPLDHHDPIAARFCRATIDGVLPRGCICRQDK
jgi:hypothetical protein